MPPWQQQISAYLTSFSDYLASISNQPCSLLAIEAITQIVIGAILLYVLLLCGARLVGWCVCSLAAVIGIPVVAVITRALIPVAAHGVAFLENPPTTRSRAATLSEEWLFSYDRASNPFVRGIRHIRDSFNTIINWSSALVLVAATLVTITAFLAPALLHDGDDFIARAHVCLRQLDSLRTGFAGYYWRLILLAFFLTCTFVYTPRTDKFYHEVIFPRRTVWVTFSVVFCSTLWLTSALGIDLKARVAAVQPLLYHTAQTADRLAIELQMYQTVTPTPQPSSGKTQPANQSPTSTPQAANDVSSRDVSLQDIQSYSSYLLADTNELSQTLADSWMVPKLISVSLPSTAAAVVVTFTLGSGAETKSGEDVLRASAASAALLAGQLNSVLQGDAKTWQNDFQWRPLSHHRSLLESIQMTLGDLTSVSALPYFTIAVLYAVFLLLPWLIYFVYITARRGKITTATIKDLVDFGVLDRFMAPEARDDEDIHWAKQWRQCLVDTQRDAKKKMLCVCDGVKNHHDEARRIFSPRVYDGLARGNINLPPAYIGAAKRETERFVVGRAQFYSLQYLIPLILLTIVSAIGWYYTFLAGTMTNLYEFSRAGGSTSLLNNLLMHNVTPFTAAFLGGWIFIIVMLFNNWARDDLYPRSYFYAAAHLMIAMIAGFVFATALGQDSAPWFAVTMTGAALLVSILPYDSIGLITAHWLDYLGQKLNLDKQANGGKQQDAPVQAETGGVNTAGNKYPNASNNNSNNNSWITHELRTLPGMTIWHETRLHQEGIDSISDLAGVDPARLIVQTQYSGYTIAQWVDIALLRIHTSSATIEQLAQENVVSATDLLLYSFEIKDPQKLFGADGAAPEDVRTEAKRWLQFMMSNDEICPAGGLAVLKKAPEPDNSKYRHILAALTLERNFTYLLQYRLSTLLLADSVPAAKAFTADSANSLSDSSTVLPTQSPPPGYANGSAPAPLAMVG